LNNKPLITIITPTFNSEATILNNLKSICDQKFENWEHIIIDNQSSDKTIDIVKKNDCHKTKIISGKDDGIYDAINKGIKVSNGDIVSILHSDDFYNDKNTLSSVVSYFLKYQVDIVFGDLIYVKKSNVEDILRYWKSSDFQTGQFLKGWSPPHPSFFVKSKIYSEHGLYKNNLGNPADIELMYRFLEKKKIKSKYLNKILVVMRYGGASNKNFKNILKQNLTILSILGIKHNYPKIIYFFVFKIINRIKQLLKNT